MKKKKAEPPLFDLTSESEHNSTTPANTVPLSNLKRLIANLDDEDDIDIVPVKKERKSSIQLPASTSDSSIKVAHSSSGIKKTAQPLDSIVAVASGTKVPEKKNLLSIHKQKKGPSAASTRIRKRKAIDSDFQRQGERDEDDSDQPPLKRLKLRNKALERTTNGSNFSTRASSIVKSETPARTPTKRVRDSQPRAASVLWPKIEKPTFEQVCGAISLSLRLV